MARASLKWEYDCNCRYYASENEKHIILGADNGLLLMADNDNRIIDGAEDDFPKLCSLFYAHKFEEKQISEKK